MNPEDEPTPESPPITQPKPQALPGIPMPPAVIVLALITLAALVSSLGRLPHAISDGISLTRSERDLSEHNGRVASQAVPSLEALAKRYPAATDLKVDLADAYEQAHLFDKAAQTLNSMVGNSLSKEDYARAQEISSRLEKDGSAYHTEPAGPGDTDSPGGQDQP